MKTKSSWNYYGVKIIKQLIVKSEGNPNNNQMDEYSFDNDKQDFEEVIILVHAQSFDHAYEVAEKKAAKHEKSYLNIYNQQVVWKVIAAIDCFLICDELRSGTEIYSCFHTANKNENAKDFIKNQFHASEGCRKGRQL